MDKFKFARMSLDAQVKVAQTLVDEARANLNNSRTNLIYTEIRSPVDGIVINRKIDPGQTVAAQFQTPELFIVAPDMKYHRGIGEFAGKTYSVTGEVLTPAEYEKHLAETLPNPKEQQFIAALMPQPGWIAPRESLISS